MDLFALNLAKKLSGGGGSSGGGVNLSDLLIFIGDYTNDPVTLTLGSIDKFYRRIYGQ